MTATNQTPLDAFIADLERRVNRHAPDQSGKPVADGKRDGNPLEGGHTLSLGRHVHVSPPKAASVADGKRDGKRDKLVTLRGLPPSAYGVICTVSTADTDTAEHAAAIEWFMMLNGDAIIDEITALERCCEQLARAGADAATYRAAVTALVARKQQIRAWHRAANGNEAVGETPRPRWRLTVDVNHPVPGPVRLDDGTEVADVARFVAQTFTAIDYVLQQPPRSYPDGAALIPVYIGQLEQVGVIARVESMS